MAVKVSRDKLPVASQLKLAQLELQNAKLAVDSLPAIEQAQQRRVDQAKERLKIETDQLKRIQTHERAEAEQRVQDLEKKVQELTKRSR